MSDNKEKVLKRVQKLLNLGDASKNSSESEVQNALLMAQKMMAEHGLSMQDVGAIEEEKPEVVQRYASYGSKNMPWWYRDLAHVIANNFRVKFLVGTRVRQTKQKAKQGDYATSIIFLGLLDDVALAIEVYQFAMDAIKYHADRYARREYAKGTPMTGLRDAFTEGFIEGLSKKFEAQVAANNWLAVLDLHPAVVERINQMGLDQMQFKFNGNLTDAHLRAKAFAAGEEEGKRFEVQKTALKEENQ